MKVSLKWLNNYVHVKDLNPDELAHKLTFAGIEVESIYKLADATNLVIGEVISCEMHPDSDHLHVTKVDMGPKYGIEQIVCGAPNVRVGLKVIVARVGAKLGNITITNSVIRGVSSCGMLCSLLELGVDSKFLREEQINGIEELPSDAEVGNENVLEYLGLDDTILDLKLLANRSDCLSMLNIAREVGALYEREVTVPSLKERACVENELHVESLTSLCSQIDIKVIKDVKIKESPEWLKQILHAEGVRSINNIVDIGNYIMLLTGQPLHMYDLDKLPKKELVVRDDIEDDWVALDEKTYHIQKGDIAITSDGKVMCLGGVMGSLACAVDENTKNIAIESASFDAKTIRHTSTRLNLVSESSIRFVKGTNVHQAAYVLNLTADLVKELADGKVETEIVSYDVNDNKPRVIDFTVDMINNRLGTSFSEEEVIHTLNRVGISIEKTDTLLKASVPDWRIDIALPADLSEEVIRLLGFDNVVSQLPCLDLTLGALKETQNKEKIVRDYLLENGLHETLNYTLVSEQEAKQFKKFNDGEQYQLLHPMTEDRKIVRSVVLPSLLECCKYNVSRQGKDFGLFEVSDVYTKERRATHLGIILYGNQLNQGILQKTPFSFYHVKGYLQGILTLLGIEPSRYRLEAIKDYSELHPGRSAGLYLGKKCVGILGELHPNIIKEYDLGKGPVVVMELDLSSIFELKTSVTKAVAPSKYPTVSRDLALVVKKDISFDEIKRTCLQCERSIIKDVDVFDIYEGEHVEANYKSVAISILYGDANRQFTSDDINEIEKKVIDTLKNKLGIVLRS